MKKGLAEIVFILDRSDSMWNFRKDVIKGFNSRIESEKRSKEAVHVSTALVSTILFDDDSEVLYDRVEIEKIEPMTEKQYFVGGSTALCDAIGDAIHHIGNIQYMRDEDRPEKTIFVITTDGYENASRRYDADRVWKIMNRQKEEYGWKFIFYGAKINPVETEHVPEYVPGPFSELYSAFRRGRSGRFHDFSYLSL